MSDQSNLYLVPQVDLDPMVGTDYPIDQVNYHVAEVVLPIAMSPQLVVHPTIVDEGAAFPMDFVEAEVVLALPMV